MSLWHGIGIVLAGYLLICLLRGEVHAKRGIHMDTLYRNLQPGRYWLTMGIYAVLDIALFTIF